MSMEKDKTLILALSYCDLAECPKEDTKEYIWLKALAYVKKSDGSANYVVVQRNEDGNPQIIKDFGNVAAIVKTEKYYPFMLLDKKYIPVFTGRAAAENRIKWLRGRGEKGDLESMPQKELELKVMQYAMRDALSVAKNI